MLYIVCCMYSVFVKYFRFFFCERINSKTSTAFTRMSVRRPVSVTLKDSGEHSKTV